MTTATGHPAAAAAGGATLTQRYYRRFAPIERVMHSALMLTFVGCALTGLPLLYSEKAWAGPLARILGGFESAGVIHRICAFVMIVVFVSHVVLVFARAIAGRRLLSVLWGPDSLVPQPQDAIDVWNNFKWFVGRGPQPQFDRWTYWEKFDYWAVFWGMFIIGGSGLLLWFPLFFAHVLPGWMFNIASLVHGEEALLAVGFIFTFHFFNGHLRPGKFPMDLVIFTGVVPASELQHERAGQWERLVAGGSLDPLVTSAPDAAAVRRGRILGTIGLTAGLAIVALILFAVLR